jgi:hypothetical protein
VTSYRATLRPRGAGDEYAGKMGHGSDSRCAR